LLKHGDGFGIAARDRIADHHQVGTWRDMLRRRYPGRTSNARRCEIAAHGRIDVLIGAGHPKAPRLEHSREGRHADAAHGDQMDMGARRQQRRSWKERFHDEVVNVRAKIL
jgi:hypothetical protein